jgi:hypothetical protein
VLCSRITNVLTLLDPTNLRTAHMEAPVYWRAPYQAMMSSRQLVEYIVLDIEPLQGAPGSGYGAFAQGGTRWCLAEAQVARKSDFGRNDTVFYTKTHLGHILHPGGWVRSGVVSCHLFATCQIWPSLCSLPDMAVSCSLSDMAISCSLPDMARRDMAKTMCAVGLCYWWSGVSSRCMCLSAVVNYSLA